MIDRPHPDVVWLTPVLTADTQGDKATCHTSFVGGLRSIQCGFTNVPFPGTT
ncbi:hypothetical protein [Micromonospora okii]|uniref:hypothetical protein n=1 Tax=Micromonospora okii TaxID=1182970 RepID=UPI001E622FB1|nr:hypothetical protein [Micromonospora okii]